MSKQDETTSKHVATLVSVALGQATQALAGGGSIGNYCPPAGVVPALCAIAAALNRLADLAEAEQAANAAVQDDFRAHAEQIRSGK